MNIEKAFFEEDMRRQYGRTFEGLYELLINAMVPNRTPLIKRLNSILPSTVKPIRFINWMMKNEVCLRDYEDYREMVEALGIPFDGDYVVIPKNWENKHTEIVENYSILLENQLERGTHLRVTNAVSNLRAEKRRREEEKKEAKLRIVTAERLANMMKAHLSFLKMKVKLSERVNTYITVLEGIQRNTLSTVPLLLSSYVIKLTEKLLFIP